MNPPSSYHSKPDRAAWLTGPGHDCHPTPWPHDRAWRVVLLGAPGVGKGTQAELLSHELGACHLSTGDVFRNARGCDETALSPAMADAIHAMHRGSLVPDRTVIDLIRERHACLSCRGGFLLDGFPRTVAQADSLQAILQDDGVTLDAVIDYVLPVDQLVDRTSGRRVCAKCKAVFHLTSLPPKIPGICDRCSGPLTQRTDDHPEPVRVRMEAYEQSTAPLTEFYNKLGLLLLIPASGSPQEVFQSTMAKLSTFAPARPG